MWEGVGDRTELQYIDPHSYGRQRCVYLVLQGCSTGGLRAQLSAGWWLSLLHLVTNFSGPQLNHGPQGPPPPGGGFLYHILSLSRLTSNSLGDSVDPFGLVWLSLPHLISNSVYFLSSPSYIIVQSPTQSLEWHVWSSSSGNNCHAVQMSLSSGASVYEWIMGFYLVPFHQPNPPKRFLSITGHWNVSLPSGASLWNGIFGRVEGQNTTSVQSWCI